MSVGPLLKVSHLTMVIDIGGNLVPAVHDISFEIARGETLGLVGESVTLEGRELLSLDARAMRSVRGAENSSAMPSLNPDGQPPRLAVDPSTFDPLAPLRLVGETHRAAA